jgi:hypothetical protein
MKSDYDYYLIGCREMGVTPIRRWRFDLAYAKYRRARMQDLEARLPLNPRKRQRVVARWSRLRMLGDLVRQGRDIADRVKHSNPGEDEPGAAGAGMREPIPPRQPVLVGCGALSIPQDNDPHDNVWWRI